MISINSNLSVLRAQNNMNKNIYMLGTALQRMSTGYKINSAADDTTGLYIATGLNTQVRGLTQAQTNVSMGQSVLNIAEGSLNNISDMLNRIKDLALQGANSYYSADSREAMQKEADKLIEEIKKQNKETTFNGKNVFGSVSETVSSNVGVSSVSSDTVPSGYTAIYTAEDLNNVRNNLSGKYILMADIDLSSVENWEPIGTTSNFTGTFDGNGHVIKNLKSTNGGLFKTTYKATIQNLGIENIDINTTNGTVGGLVGYAEQGTITNCYTTGNINGGATLGGLVGNSYATITNCYSEANVSSTRDNIGGLIGQAINAGSIAHCYSTGNVSGRNSIGGLVGYLNRDITDCYTTSNVSGSKYVGLISGSISNNTCTNVYADRKDSNLNAFGAKGGTITNSGAVEHSEFTSHEFWDKQGLDSNVWEMSCSIPPVLKGVGTNNINWYFGRGNNESRLQTGEGSDPSANSMTINTGLDLGAMKVDFSTVEGCLDAYKCAQAALDAIAKRSANIGTTQNKLDSVLQSQTTQIENATSAKSTITDADIAQESAEYTKQQILTQTSSALLMHANKLDANTVTNLINSLR